jgi:hypothetical protein
VIVDPDFLTHWRTLMLIDELGGDEMAPLYVIRLWGHCQTRRSDTFEMPAAGLKALCRYKGSAEEFEAAMVSAGFLHRDGRLISVPKWLEHNAALVKNWTNGATGGRPKKTQTEPNDNPNETQTEPNDNPGLTQAEPIREEGREDKRRTKPEVLASGVPSSPPATSAGRVCARLRQAGVASVNPSNPKLLALIDAGMTEDELADLASEHGSQGKGFAWLLAAAEGRRRDASTIRPLPRASPGALADRNKAAAEAAKQMIFGQEAQRATG